MPLDNGFGRELIQETHHDILEMFGTASCRFVGVDGGVVFVLPLSLPGLFSRRAISSRVPRGEMFEDGASNDLAEESQQTTQPNQAWPCLTLVHISNGERRPPSREACPGDPMSS